MDLLSKNPSPSGESEGGLRGLRGILGTHLPFLVLGTFLCTIIDTLFYLFVAHTYDRAFIIIGSNFMMTLGMVLVIMLLSFVKADKIAKYVFEFIISAYVCLLAFCWIKFGSTIDKGMIALINGTNPQEASEFFSVYVTTPSIVLFVIAVLIVFGCFVFLTRKPYKAGKKQMIALGVFFIFGCCSLGFSFYTIPGRIEAIFRTQKKNLADYLHHPTMKPTREAHPDMVMMVIGESHVRSHSSLYGYDKETSPRLRKLRDSGNLICFTQTVSPATHTAESFKYFMTDCPSADDETPWYESLTIPEAVQCSGYRTAWFSNQAYSGWHDNVSASFADLCQTVVYAKEKGSDELLANPDGVLFPFVSDYAEKNCDKDTRHCIFINLMGHHQDYSLRYPDSWSKFKDSDYASKPENQRHTYATYDNACLYNDYVLDSLFSVLNHRNAVAIYFSDHGQDFYDSAPDYCSHSNDNNPVSYNAGIQIPLFIYMTDEYRATHPDIVEKLKAMSTKPFNTTNMMSLLLYLIGYEKQ